MTLGLAPPPPHDFLERANKLGARCGADDLARLGDYLERLLVANERMNLTTVLADDAWSRHVLDSLCLAPHLEALPEGSPVVDIGSGGGLPALPVAILFGKLRFTLVEATGKKADFLRQTCEALGVDATVVCERIEEFGRGPARGSFRAVTSRALAPLPVLLEYAIPLLEVEGECLAMKGARAEQERAQSDHALRELGAAYVDTHPTATGAVMRFRKHAETPARYPRRTGVPSKRPL